MKNNLSNLSNLSLNLREKKEVIIIRKMTEEGDFLGFDTDSSEELFSFIKTVDPIRYNSIWEKMKCKYFEVILSFHFQLFHTF